MSRKKAAAPPRARGGVLEPATAASRASLPWDARWRLALNVALVFVLGAILGWRQIFSPDIGFHLSSARWIVEHGTFPRTDPFSFTFTDHPYYDLQWLFQLALYGAQQIGGPSLILLMKIAATFAFWGLLLARSWRREGRLPSSVPLLLLCVALADYYEERPQLFSWIYGSLVLWILEEHARGHRRWLPALPVVMLLWVNSHSLFVLGLVIMGIYALWEMRKGNTGDRRLLIAALLAGLICVANPYFLQGLLLPLTQFREIQQGQAFKSAAGAIWEFQSPFSGSYYLTGGRFVLFQSALYWHLYCVLAAAGLLGSWRRARGPEVTVGILFLYIFCQSNKNFGYLVMATFPMVAGGLDALGAKLWQWVGRNGSWLKTLARTAWQSVRIGGIAALCVTLILLAGTGRLYKLGWNSQRPGTSFNKACLPVESCQFLQQHKLNGRVLTTFACGGYVNWATRLPVSIYGIAEVVGPEFYAQYLESKSPDAFPRYLGEWQPTIAVVPFTEVPFWLYYLKSRPDWRLVQHDDTFALFVHQSVGGPPACPAPKPGLDYRVYSREEMKAALQEAAARPTMTLAQWLRGSDAIPQSGIRICGFHFHTGRLRACVNEGIEALGESRVRIPELFLILGHAFNGLRDYELSDFCFQTFLRDAPDAPEKTEIETAVKSRR